jgi:hypothetical protein
MGLSRSARFADTNPSSVADFVRATFSHKGRREEEGACVLILTA